MGYYETYIVLAALKANKENKNNPWYPYYQPGWASGPFDRQRDAKRWINREWQYEPKARDFNFIIVRCRTDDYDYQYGSPIIREEESCRKRTKKEREDVRYWYSHVVYQQKPCTVTYRFRQGEEQASKRMIEGMSEGTKYAATKILLPEE